MYERVQGSLCLFGSRLLTLLQAFVHAVGAMGQSHEQISSSLLADVCTPLKALQKRKVGERGELLKAASALHAAYEKNMQQLDKVPQARRACDCGEN